MAIVFLNGNFVEAAEAAISIYDRSYLFGEGVFETFRSHEGKFPLLKRHLNRLEWSTTFLDLTVPKENFSKICRDLLEKNKLKDGRFKIVLSATEAGESNCVVFCEKFSAPSPPHVYTLMTARSYVNDALPFAAVKTTNRLVKLKAHKDAVEAGFHDAILLNSRGQVTETTTANIFWIDSNAKLMTVLSEQGMLTGVMRSLLMETLSENKLKIFEGAIKPEDLSSSREVFVTNALWGIVPVGRIDARQISGGEIGPITEMLKELLEKKVKGLTERETT